MSQEAGLQDPSQLFWRVKIWGLLHDPQLKSLYSKKDQQSIWAEILQKLGNSNPDALKKAVQEADFIAAASDRPAWDQDNKRGHVDYNHAAGLHVSHLLSGERQSVVISGRRDAHPSQDQELKDSEAAIIREQLFPLIDGLGAEEAAQKAFWWLWRCLPVALAKEFGENIALLPADTRIPDCSLWSHNSAVSALAGTLIASESDGNSRPHLAIFTMTPVQEMIKASRKMQDFWAGSWLLHYLSARICWKWACKYGPDSLVYPSLYAQPLIDHWLLKKYPNFDQWIEQPTSKQLLTAGFPNVLVAVLPEHVVRKAKGNAFAIAEGVLREEWLSLSDRVWKRLPKIANVTKERVWDGWLKHQWQTYWTALPLGDSSSPLTMQQGAPPMKGAATPLPSTRDARVRFLKWANTQNKFCRTKELPDQALNQQDMTWNSSAFVDPNAVGSEHTKDNNCPRDNNCPSLAELKTYKNFNVGLWWAKVFDQLRYNMAAVKSARSWELPSVFSPRSTISGIGVVLHPQQVDRDGKRVDWVAEGETRKFWQKERGWFDGREELNATEVLKRGLPKILPDLLGCNEQKLGSAYPDLTVGVAGLLHQLEQRVEQDGDQEAQKMIDRYCKIGESIGRKFDWAQEAKQERWGIPWVDNSPQHRRFPHPRLLDDGWLVEDFEPDSAQPISPEEQAKQIRNKREEIRDVIESVLPPEQNPTRWYVLAAGDGDDMGGWLKGGKLKAYQNYVPDNYPDAKARQNWEGVEAFLNSRKRMGPATHAALSRALLDFSNQLVPYLTEERYAGRLIYSGGDDVLAYSNLWEWDQWLWDVRQCFQGQRDPKAEFANAGDYWQGQQGQVPDHLAARPLFTMGHTATISFGVVIANAGVPLAIALENLWEAEAEAKKHFCKLLDKDKRQKNAVQVRVLYGNGNTLTATAKFEAFDCWRSLLTAIPNLEPALFEQAAELWKQHPVPSALALAPWVQAFCSRREALAKDSSQEAFGKSLNAFLEAMWNTTDERDREIQSWLKLAAFVLRKRDIDLGGK
jgi:CRISPR-associated protein Cmr2